MKNDNKKVMARKNENIMNQNSIKTKVLRKSRTNTRKKIKAMRRINMVHQTLRSYPLILSYHNIRAKSNLLILDSPWTPMSQKTSTMQQLKGPNKPSKIKILSIIFTKLYF